MTNSNSVEMSQLLTQFSSFSESCDLLDLAPYLNESLLIKLNTGSVVQTIATADWLESSVSSVQALSNRAFEMEDELSSRIEFEVSAVSRDEVNVHLTISSEFCIDPAKIAGVVYTALMCLQVSINVSPVTDSQAVWQLYQNRCNPSTSLFLAGMLTKLVAGRMSSFEMSITRPNVVKWAKQINPKLKEASVLSKLGIM